MSVAPTRPPTQRHSDDRPGEPRAGARRLILSGPRAERLVRWGLIEMAIAFGTTGLEFLLIPDAVLRSLADVGELFGDFDAPPPSEQKMWLALAFSYMAVITAVSAFAAFDPARQRPLLLVLVVGKLASSLSALAFFVVDQQVFAYLLNFVVDASLVVLAAWLWVVAGRIGRPQPTGPGWPADPARTFAAFARTMAPPGGGLPAGEAEVPVAERVSRYIAGLPPRLATRVHLAVWAFDHLPFPRRFSRLPEAAQLRRLERLAARGHGVRAELLLAMRALFGVAWAGSEQVGDAIGTRPACAVASDADVPPPPPALGDLDPPPSGEDCDVVIVGSGAGGATAAARLAGAGLDVVVVEAGGLADRDSYPADPLDALAALYRDGGLTVAEGRPAIPVPVGRTVGGTTVVNSGTCFRTPDPVLARWKAEHGIPWAEQLDDRFAEAEQQLAVTPIGDEGLGGNGHACLDGARALGVSAGPISRNAGRCVQCSSCPVGCRLDAKRSMHVSTLPRAVADGARVRAGTEVRAILVENGRAAGVQAVGPDGRPRTIRARAVVCAGGAIGTPELLLRSGLATAEVGRHLHIHPAVWVGARFERPIRGWEGVMQSAYVDEWADRGLLLEATFTPLAFGSHWLGGVGAEHARRVRDYGHMGSIGVHLSDRSEGRVQLGGDGHARLRYRLRRDDAAALVFGIARAAEIMFAAGASEVYPQLAGADPITPGGVAAFEAGSHPPSRLRLEAFHPMGTARMDPDPRRGVVGPDGQAHHLPGLYVADASVFPSSLGVNPMMTIIACADQIASDLADRLAS
ncbi:MAG: GMC family oxidoreductase N-terminal domain-containing protein [Solirubrobacterales bacterium]